MKEPHRQMEFPELQMKKLTAVLGEEIWAVGESPGRTDGHA